jgi:hypothetical protein
MGFGLLCSPALYICNLYTMKKSVKKRLLTRAEALSGALPPRFRGAHMISVQTASRAVNEVVDGRGAVFNRQSDFSAEAERLGGMDFTGNQEQKGICAD